MNSTGKKIRELEKNVLPDNPTPFNLCLENEAEIELNIEQSLFDQGNDEFTVKIAQTPEEIKEYLEVGYEYVCKKDKLIFMRKRK